MSFSIHQFLPSISHGDAVSNEVLSLQKLSHKRNINSEIFVASNIENLPGVKPYKKYPAIAKKNDVQIWHVAIGDPMYEWFFTIEGKKVLIYHNFTPRKFFVDFYDKGINEGLDLMEEQLEKMSESFDLVYAKSSFSARELEQYGFKDVKVLPIIYNFKLAKNTIPDKEIQQKLTASPDHKNILFLGRVAPHKKQDDIVKAFYLYNKHINPDSTLYIVGKPVPTYLSEVERVVSALQLDDNVVITGRVSNEEMYAYYKYCDLFLSMSEHEGFFVPTLECMYFELPMLIYACTAAQETPGDAALYFKEKKYEEVAEMIDLVLTDEELREEMIKKGKKRLEMFMPETIVEELTTEIERLGTYYA